MPNPTDRFARWGSKAYGVEGGHKRRVKAPYKHPEQDLQSAVCTYLTYALPRDVEWTATLSGAHLGQLQRMKAKLTGLRPGISDIVLAVPSRGGFFLELKPPKGKGQYRYLTPGQERWAAALGHRWKTCHSIEEVETALIGWGLTPRCTIAEANRYAGRQQNPDPQGELDV